MAIGMTMTSRNSGSNSPPFRRVMNRQMRSETFPAKADPNTPPTKGAIYNNPTDRRDKLYGLELALLGEMETYGVSKICATTSDRTMSHTILNEYNNVAYG